MKLPALPARIRNEEYGKGFFMFMPLLLSFHIPLHSAAVSAAKHNLPGIRRSGTPQSHKTDGISGGNATRHFPILPDFGLFFNPTALPNFISACKICPFLPETDFFPVNQTLCNFSSSLSV